MAYYITPPEKVGGHVPRVPHQIAPMNGPVSNRYIERLKIQYEPATYSGSENEAKFL